MAAIRPMYRSALVSLACALACTLIPAPAAADSYQCPVPPTSDAWLTPFWQSTRMAVGYDSLRNELVWGSNHPMRLSLEPCGTWSQLPLRTSVVPGGFLPSWAAYDPVHNRILDVISISSFSQRGMWELLLGDSAEWRRIPTSGPLPVLNAYMSDVVFDPVSQRLIVVGSADSVWVISVGDSAVSTVVQPATGPGPRRTPALVWDPVRNRAILHGGVVNNVTVMSDTWALTLDPTPTWQQLGTVGSAPALSTHFGVYDAVADRVVFEGGYGYAGSWALALSGTPAWSVVPASGPRPWPNAYLFTYPVLDRRSGRWLMQSINSPTVFNRVSVMSMTLGDSALWKLVAEPDAPTWQRLPTMPGPANTPLETYDTQRNRIIFSASPTLNTLELTAGETWQTLSPPGGGGFSSVSAGVYDPVRDRVLASSNGIWELGMAPGSSWRQVPVAGPAPGGGLPWLYDPIHDRVVTVDEHGRTAPLSVSTLSLGDTLRWSGPNSLTAIPLRAGTALAIDTRRDRLLVFGGASTSQLLAQVWSVDLEDWHCEQLAIADTFFMTARSGASAAYDPLRDRLIVCGGHVNGVSTSQFLGMLELSGSPTWVAPALREADFDLARPNDGLWPSPRDRAFTYFDPVRDRLIVNGGSYLEIDYSQDVANGFTLDWGNARAPQIGCASLPAQVSGTARAAWAVSNPMPLAADLEWNVTSSRAWPGLPATGTLSLPALSADSIVVTYTVPDTAAPGPVDLTLVTSLVGAPMLADTCVAAGINAVDVAGPPARVFELRLAGGQPVRGALGVELAVPAAGAVTVDVFDVAGRRVASTRTNGAAGGRARLDAAPGRRLPPGLYAVRARWAGEERVIRAVVVH